MGLLFSSSSDASTSIDNSVTDNSQQINNAGALQAGGDLSITQTADGAFEVVGQAIGANQQVLDRALQEVGSTVKVSTRTAESAIDRSLAVASERSESQGEKLMDGVTKIGLGLAAVIAVGFFAMGKK